MSKGSAESPTDEEMRKASDLLRGIMQDQIIYGVAFLMAKQGQQPERLDPKKVIGFTDKLIDKGE